MKKAVLTLLTITLFFSCSKNESNYESKLLAIDQAITPNSFTFKKAHDITVKYTLPNGCHAFVDLYYQHNDTIRIVAIKAIHNFDLICTQATIQKEYTFQVVASQKKDYVFKFWKGKDLNNKDLFEEVVIPVNY